MIRDPSDGSVRPANPQGEIGIPISKPVLQTSTSGLQTGSQKPENLERLERSRAQLKRYQETGKWDDLVRSDNEPELPPQG